MQLNKTNQIYTTKQHLELKTHKGWYVIKQDTQTQPNLRKILRLICSHQKLFHCFILNFYAVENEKLTL